MLGDLALGALISFGIATMTTPVGVSGAVFLVPVQVSVLGVANPAVTPTNLLYNLIAIPGALFEFRRQRPIGGPLLRLLVLGTVPGVVVGGVLRVEVLPGADAFRVVMAAVLIPLGGWLATSSPLVRKATPGVAERRRIALLALGVGVVGGIYGIGGGSILAPVLVGMGFAVAEVAPAALAATFLTSIAGVLTFAVLSFSASGDVAPDWGLGVALGLGGLAGASIGARLQPRLPEGLLRRALGILALGLGLGYAVTVLT
ncbi:MAG: TSUP family transporter [Solirubrobacterales bacterium]